MVTIQDTFDDTSGLQDLVASNVVSGTLGNEDLQSNNILSFDGVNDYIDIGINKLNALLGGVAGVTMSAWVQLGSLGSDRTVIIFLVSDGYIGGRININVDNTVSAGGRSQAADGFQNVNSTTTLEADRWYHLTVVIDYANDTNSVYIDGVLDNSGAVTYGSSVYVSGTPTGINNELIGTSEFSSTYYSPFDGKIAQVAVFNYVLSDAEIRALREVGYDNVSGITAAIAYWKLDEGTGTTANDSIGSNDGTINGASWGTGNLYTLRSRTTSKNKLGSAITLANVNSFAYTSNFKSGGTTSRISFAEDYDTDRENVLSFDGVDDYVDVAGDSNLDAIGENITLAAWIYIPALPSSSGEIFLKGTSAAHPIPFQFRLDTSGNLDFYQSQSAAFQTQITGSNPIPIGQWTHVAATNDGTTAFTYINGMVDGTDASPANAVDTDTENMGIGANVIAGSGYFNGKIADARIYNDALTAAEVLWVYTNGNRGTDPTTANLVNRWKLDEGTGSTATDSAGSNNGTITGATWDTDTHLAQWFPSWKNSNGDLVNSRACYKFDGVNDYIDGGAPISGTEYKAGVTFSAWANANDVTSNRQIIELGDGNWVLVRLYIGSGDFLFAQRNDNPGNEVFLLAIGPAIIGRWYHVAVTYNGSGSWLSYLDGIPVGSHTSTITGTYNLTNARIGSRANTSSEFFNGNIKDVRIYTAALSDADIFDLYSQGKEPSTANLEAYWKLDGNSLDETSNNNDGTVYGATPLGKWTSMPIVGTSLNQRVVAIFDGVNDYVAIPDDASLEVGASDFTVIAWVKIREFTGGSQSIYGSYDSTTTNQRKLLFGLDASDELRLITSFNNTSIKLSSSTNANLSTETWYHVVVTKSGTGCDFYVDGRHLTDDGVVVDATVVNNDIGFHIGVLSEGTLSGFWSGDISNVAFYNDVRTASEILTDYHNGYIDETDANLVSYWPLEGDYLDWKGSNHGTNNGATSIKVIDGPMGKRNFDLDNTLGFDGNDDKVTVTDAASIQNIFDGGGSVCGWVYPFTSGSGSGGRIVDKRVASGTGWMLLTESGADLIAFFHEFSTGNGRWASTSSIALNQWSFIAVTYDADSTANNPIIYVNGVSVSISETATPSGTRDSDVGQDMEIGNVTGGTAAFDGNMADVRIYDDALTADEVLWVYTNGAKGTDPTTTNLQSHYKLDEGAGSTASDSSSNGNDGTITSATWQHSTRPPMNLANQVDANVASLAFTENVYARSMTETIGSVN